MGVEHSGEAGWCTTNGNIRHPYPTLARVKGVSTQHNILGI